MMGFPILREFVRLGQRIGVPGLAASRYLHWGIAYGARGLRVAGVEGDRPSIWPRDLRLYWLLCAFRGTFTRLLLLLLYRLGRWPSAPFRSSGTHVIHGWSIAIAS